MLRCGKLPSGESLIEEVEFPLSDNDPSDSSSIYLLHSIIINTGQDNRPHAKISILGKEHMTLLDSGANCSLLGGRNTNIVDELGLRKGMVCGGTKTADGTQHEIKNFARLSLAYNYRNEMLSFLLAPSIPDCIILGMDFWEKFGVKPICCSMETPIQSGMPTARASRQSISKEISERLLIGFGASSS